MSFHISSTKGLFARIKIIKRLIGHITRMDDNKKLNLPYGWAFLLQRELQNSYGSNHNNIWKAERILLQHKGFGKRIIFLRSQRKTCAVPTALMVMYG